MDREYDIFISYSHADMKWVSILSERLEEHGFKVWRDLKIRSGDSIDENIVAKLESSCCVLAVWSPNSVKSGWVLSESAWAADRDKFFCISTQQRIDFPIRFYRRRAEAFTDWDGSANDPRFIRLCSDLSTFVGAASAAPNSPFDAGLEAFASAPTSKRYHLVKIILASATLVILVAASWFVIRTDDSLLEIDGDSIKEQRSKLQFNFALFTGDRSGDFRAVNNGDELVSRALYWIGVESIQKSYLYVFQKDSTGQIDKLFPRHGSDGQIGAGTRLTIPKSGAFQLDDQTGREVIYFVGLNDPDACLDSMPMRVASTQKNPCAVWFDDTEVSVRPVLTPDQAIGKGLLGIVNTEVEFACKNCSYFINFQHRSL